MVRNYSLISVLLLFGSFNGQAQFDSLYAVITSDIDNEQAFKAADKYFVSNLYVDPNTIRTKTKKLADFYKDKDDVKSAMCMRLHALSYYILEDYDSALDILLPLIEIMKQKGTASNLATIYSSLALAYKLRGELETVEHYSKEAIKLFEIDKDSANIAGTMNNLAMHYMEQDRYSEAELYYEKAIDFFRKTNASGQLAIALLNRGAMNVRQQKNEEGKKAVYETLEYFTVTNNVLALGLAYTTIGNAELNLGNLTESETNLLKGYDFVTQAKHSQQISITTELLSRLYAAKGTYNLAYRHLQEWGMLRDSFQSAEQDARLVDALKKYESEAKQKEIELLSVKNAVANRQTTLSLLAAGALGLFAFLLFKNRNKIRKMNQTLETQKVEIEQNLQDKEFLLKEIHHRVKNNLQVISSLLKLQAKSLSDKQAIQALDDGRIRVRSMALIHQNLYQKDNLSGIKIDDYIEQLTHELLDTYQFDDTRLDVSVDVEDMVLDVESVVPIGLIINELISNSLKYAFESKSEGVLKVSLTRKSEGLQLIVEDNGRGFEKDEIRKDSFGHSLIDAFAHRLGAKYSIDGSHGTKASFLITKYKMAA